MKPYAIKRPKHSASVNDETKQDIISKLPAALLIRILSLLPDDDACRTSILSKRWRDVWMFLPNLRLIMPLSETKEQIENFYDLVDKTLAIRGGMPIQKFSLSCSEGCDYDRVYRWLCVVVQCEVETLVLQFPTEDPIQQVDCFWDLFKTCDTLVELTLEGGSWLNVPKADVLIPRLKKIRLNYCYLPHESLNNLIMGCPVLEEMSLVGYELTDQLLKLRLDSSQYFTRLRICSRGTSKFDVVLHEYRYMQDYCIFPPDIVQKPLPFVEVYDLIINNDSHDYLFSYITRAKILTLTDSSLEALVFKGLHKCTFSNVVKFVGPIQSLIVPLTGFV